MKRFSSSLRRICCLLSSALILSFLFLPVSAQEEPMVMVASTNSFYNSSYEYRYNDKGQMIKRISDTGEITQYEYHSSGKVKKERVLRDNRVTDVREYDYNGNITAVSYMDSYGSMVYTKRYANKYDEEGRLIYFHENASPYSGEEATFSYCSDGSFTVDWRTYQVIGSQKETRMHRIGYFAPDGAQLSQIQDVEYGMAYNAQWSSLLDNQGTPLSYSYVLDLEGQCQVTLKRYLNEYDSKDRLLSRKCYSSQYRQVNGKVEEDQPMELTDTTTYTYDSQDRLIRQFSDESQTETLWKYDAMGNLIYTSQAPSPFTDLEYFMMRNDGVWGGYGEETYEYMTLGEALKLS